MKPLKHSRDFISVIIAAAFFAALSNLHGADAATLKSAFAGKFDIGVAIPASLTPAERSLVTKNFTNVTPENCMKPMAIERQEGNYTYDQAGAFIAYAKASGLKVNAHTLVWRRSCPDWFFLDQGQPASRDLVLQRLRDYITAVVTHFKGGVVSWDVVNEAISDQRTEYLAKCKWLDALGPSYIAESFIAAHNADPDLQLFYNDYGIESPPKFEKTIRLIHELKAAHVPIDGIGIQAHWTLDNIPYASIEKAIDAFHAEGLKVNISELDLDVVPVRQGDPHPPDPYPAGLPPEIQSRLADQYARLFALFQKHSSEIARVTLWGLDDGRSWLNYYPAKRTNYPLLWDRSLNPKPALAAILSQASN